MCIGIRRFSTSLTKPLNRYEEGSTLAGVIYIHRISDIRFGGITGRNFNLFRKLCGESTLKNVVLVTNMWGVDPQDISEAREEELSSNFFKPALERGAQMARHYNTPQSAHDIIRRIMGNRPVVLQIQRELVDEGKDIIGTAAGESINAELKELIRRQQAELEGVRDEMMQALKKKDEERRRELDEERSKLQELMDKVTKDSESMAANYAAEKERMEAMMAEMEQKREQDKVERRQHSADLTRGPQDETNVYVADRTRLEQQVKRPQDLVGIPVATSPGELTRYSASPTRTKETEWADPGRTPPRISGPQASSLVPSYVKFLSRPATHGG